MIFLAFRYLLARRRQTLFTLLGVFFGTMAYVSVSGFFLGFQNYMVEQLVNNTAQVRIAAREDFLTDHMLDEAFYGKAYRHVFWRSPPSGVEGYLEVQNPQSWYARLKADPRVDAFSPLQIAPAIFTLAGVSRQASLLGCDPLAQMKVTNIGDYVVEGKFEDLKQGGNRVILGDELAKRLGAGMLSVVMVAVGTNPPAPFKVVGRFWTGHRDADLNAWGLLSDVQRVNRTPGQVNRIGVRLKDYRQAASIATTWMSIAPERSESWDQLFVNFLSMFKIQTALRFSMIATVLIVAGFGIYNVLNMTVNEKRQDIAILRSMGYDTFDVVMLFFSQGLLLGLVGSALGLTCGYMFCRWLQTLTFMSITPSNPQGHLHISLAAAIYVQAALMALLTASIASIFPARAAGKLTPIEIIRSGA